MVKKNIIIIRQDWYFDNYRIMNCDQESVWNKQTINQSINGNVPKQWRITEQIKSNQNYRFNAWFPGQDQREWKKHLWIKSNQINQTILEIDFDRTHSNDRGSSTFWRFGISKYYQYSIFRNTFQCHYTRIIETKSFRSYWC